MHATRAHSAPLRRPFGLLLGLVLLALLAILPAPASAAAPQPTLLVKFATPSAGPAVVRSLGDVPLSETLSGVEVVDIGSSPVLAKIQQYEALSGVDYAEPNRILHALDVATPNDPYFSQWAFSDIHAALGWDAFPGDFSAAGGVDVAVIDTGVDATHPDQQGQILAGATCSPTCAAGGHTD